MKFRFPILVILLQATDLCFLFSLYALQGKLANIPQGKAPVNVGLILYFSLLFEILALQLLHTVVIVWWLQTVVILYFTEILQLFSVKKISLILENWVLIYLTTFSTTKEVGINIWIGWYYIPVCLGWFWFMTFILE